MSELDEVLSFVYEGYTFLVCCNSTLPTCGDDDSPCETTTLALRPLRQSSSFGSIFAGTHELFELIPQVQSLYLWRLAEELMSWRDPSPEFLVAYNNLNYAIESWGTGPTGSDNNLRVLDSGQWRMAAEVIRNGLRIYLSTSLYGSAAPPFEVQQCIEWKAKNVVDAAILLEESPYASLTVWALVMAGSCLVDDQYRRRLAEFLAQSRYKMRHLSAVCKVLELLWADGAQAFGPYGLQLVIEKQGMSLSIM